MTTPMPDLAQLIERAATDFLADHFPTGLRELFDRTAQGIPVKSYVGTNCTCGWCTAATDEHEVRQEWAAHVVAASLKAISQSQGEA